MELLAPVVGWFTGGGAATTGAGLTGGATSGLTSAGVLSTVLQGTATVLGIVSAVNAGNADAFALEQQAADADMEQSIETLRGIERSTQTRKALLEATGAIDAAYAASGIDLSVGTVAQARNEAFREADFAQATAANTEITRTSRLAERAASYRSAAKRARRAGVYEGLMRGAQGFASMAGRY